MKINAAFAVGLAFVGALSTAPAQAQNRAFVAAGGSDSNACSFTAPCRSLQHAHDTLTANGVIDVLDPAGYGTLIVNRAISINGHGYAEILVGSGGGGGIGITVAAGTNDKVNLNGLIIDGQGVGGNGIRFNSGKSLTVENCVVRNHSGDGFEFIANGSSSLILSNTLVGENGGNGIYIQPLGSGSVTAVLNRVEAYNNGAHGIGISGSLSTGNLDVAVADSVVAKNGLAGIISDSTSAQTFVSFFRSVASNNGSGVAATGDGLFAGLFVSQSMIFRNNKGWDGAAGALYSYGDNVSQNYANDNPPFTLAKN